jgi:hypothetical protein
MSTIFVVARLDRAVSKSGKQLFFYHTATINWIFVDSGIAIPLRSRAEMIASVRHHREGAGACAHLRPFYSVIPVKAGILWFP